MTTTLRPAHDGEVAGCARCDQPVFGWVEYDRADGWAWGWTHGSPADHDADPLAGPGPLDVALREIATVMLISISLLVGLVLIVSVWS